MVMELMDGGELFEKIRNHVRFTEKEAREVARQVRPVYRREVASYKMDANYFNPFTTGLFTLTSKFVWH